MQILLFPILRFMMKCELPLKVGYWLKLLICIQKPFVMVKYFRTLK